MPSGVMTTTKSVPVSRRTCSASGWSTASGRAPTAPDTTTGAAARVWAMPRTSSCAASALAVDALEKAASPAPEQHDEDHRRLEGEQLGGEAPGTGPGARRARARERRRSSSPTSPPARARCCESGFRYISCFAVFVDHVPGCGPGCEDGPGFLRGGLLRAWAAKSCGDDGTAELDGHVVVGRFGLRGVPAGPSSVTGHVVGGGPCSAYQTVTTLKQISPSGTVHSTRGVSDCGPGPHP